MCCNLERSKNSYIKIKKYITLLLQTMPIFFEKKIEGKSIKIHVDETVTSDFSLKGTFQHYMMTFMGQIGKLYFFREILKNQN